ncbi:unnamed protein product [Acanthoscelides obtectus]|uniref:Uncharacterized protein n=1 Tax=Acanthoscelides obtectus TaxID=200917 RepID=A0A9P0Q4E5_ACAOB|nr:unnamed protein product [Acanthoscelides obtectus]CAK1641721.1 hypothetical protein AOBTE_LOCUS12586 [Acanthoscelides obtectus]
MTIVFRCILHEALIILVCWQIQNGIFECVNCFFW